MIDCVGIPCKISHVCPWYTNHPDIWLMRVGGGEMKKNNSHFYLSKNNFVTIDHQANPVNCMYNCTNIDLRWLLFGTQIDLI